MYILNVLVRLFITTGDFVINVFLFLLPIKRVKIFKRKKKLSGTFKISKRKERKPAKLNALKVVLFGFFERYRISRAKASLKKIAKKKRTEKLRNTPYKPGIFYKLKYVFIGSFFSFIFLFLPLLSFLFVSDLPSPSSLNVNYIPKTTKIFDRNGILLYEIFANQNRSIVRLSDVPESLKKATIAIEDKDFYNHPGFDLRGIIRAFITNIRKEGFQGGSTITQQLIKSAFLTSDPTISRKIKEIALAFWAERIYSKDEILELYLNYIPYGGTAWGIQSAAEIYFGKKVSELSLAESAFLAGLTRAPSIYSPFSGNGNLWKNRQKEVLDAMVKPGFIGANQARGAYEEELVFRNPQVPIRAPHFVMYLKKLLVDKFGLSEVERGGLQVKTSLDLSTQEEVEKIVSEEVEANAYLNVGNGASLVVSPLSGDILAMVGSKNYFDQENDGNVNLTTSLRQPGSAIKLITYALALSSGYTEATILDDTPLTIYNGTETYTPVNYDGAFHGRIPLRTAFGNSFNIPPVRIAQKLGPKAVKDFGEAMGISSWKNNNRYGVSITLGGVEVRMTDMATAYATVANGGKRINLDPILEVKDSYGAQIYKKETKGVQVLDPGVAFILSDILADNNARLIEFGANTPLNIPGRRISVKTGTTDNKRDNWTIGFDQNALVATWVGNNDNTPLNPALASGITGAAPMWNKIMSLMLAKSATPSAFPIPPNIVKKFCFGQDRYFVKGTENSVNCRQILPSVIPTPQTN